MNDYLDEVNKHSVQTAERAVLLSHLEALARCTSASLMIDERTEDQSEPTDKVHPAQRLNTS